MALLNSSSSTTILGSVMMPLAHEVPPRANRTNQPPSTPPILLRVSTTGLTRTTPPQNVHANKRPASINLGRIWYQITGGLGTRTGLIWRLLRRAPEPGFGTPAAA